MPATARLCIMNLYLHGIGPDESPIQSWMRRRQLGERPPTLLVSPWRTTPATGRFSMVLTNPPFGKKSSVRIVNKEGELETVASRKTVCAGSIHPGGRGSAP